MSTRTRFSEPKAGVPAAMGMHPSELWGVGTRNPEKHKQGTIRRSEAARARRRAKRAAKRLNIGLKAYLRKQRGK